MTYFDRVRAYLAHNPQGYWFKRKLYGWGWTPVTWQGWLVVLGYVGLVLLITLAVDVSSRNEVGLFLLVPVALLTATLIRICYKKGEPPRWQWGLPEEEKKDR